MKKYVVVFSGAGLSKESGVPTFRDAKDGLWENYRIEEVASQEGWRRDKRLVLDFYAARTRQIRSCAPNPAHLAIARLQEKYHLLNVTQNIDDLLERGGCQDVWHLHGSINFRKCEWHHSIGYGDCHCDFREAQAEPVVFGDICPKCAGQLRPDIVWFGEAVEMREHLLIDLAEKTEVFIGVGTSAQVYPAAGMLNLFGAAKEKYFIDPHPPASIRGFSILAGPAGEHLPRLADELLGRA
jgi:NAD-dependent deacetylase